MGTVAESNGKIFAGRGYRGEKYISLFFFFFFDKEERNTY